MNDRGPFTVLGGSTVLARIPLLPAVEDADRSTAVDPLLAEGMFLASRRAGGARSEGVPDRLAATTRAYELRARFRSTPHGVFAGVAVAQVLDGDAELRQAGEHRAHTYPSPAWLATLADRALHMPDVLAHLTLAASNLVVQRGQRLEHEQQATPGVAGPQLVSIRATEATLLILKLCERGASYETVAAEIGRKWPNVPEEMIRSTLLKLVRGGFLVTDLLPERVQDDPLGNLLTKLPSACPVRPSLTRLRDRLRAADRIPPGAPERLAELTAARALCDDLAYVDRPLTADVAADAQLRVPGELADEAAEAFGVLWRVSQADDPLADYHRRFLDRYGPDRFVPLLDVADPAIGLGNIEDGGEAGRPAPGRGVILAELVGRAVAHGRTEVELDEQTVVALDQHPASAPPPTSEVYATVLVASDEDLAGGRLSLAIYGGGTQQAGSTVGRFAALLPEAGIGPTTDGSALVAELVVRPRAPELVAVAPPTGFAATRIPVGLPARDCDLDLRDLLLMSDGRRMLLWSAERGRQVAPVLYSRIGPGYMPPVARLLQGLAMSGCRPWHGWSWEPLHQSPFLPRVRYKRTILSPARWRLPTALIAAAGYHSRWDSALAGWQTATVPRPSEIVVVEDADRHLPLDLRRDSDRELLRRYVRRGAATVAEPPGGSDTVQAVVAGPTGRHVLELVIPVVSRTAIASDTPRAAVRARPLGEGRYLPGSEWLSLVIPSPASYQDDVLRHLAALVAGVADRVDRWFWLRYHTNAHGPHLRVRFHGEPATLGGTVLPALSAWCADLVARRLASGLYVEPYEQEIERYGGHQAIEAAERVFDADSRLVLAVLTAAPDTDQRLVVAALSAAAITGAVAGGDVAALDGRRLDRAGRRRFSDLRPLVRTAARTGSAGLPAIMPAWTAREAALVDYRDRLSAPRRVDCAASLIHMHANRLLGDQDPERIARALAADLTAREATR